MLENCWWGSFYWTPMGYSYHIFINDKTSLKTWIVREMAYRYTYIPMCLLQALLSQFQLARLLKITCQEKWILPCWKVWQSCVNRSLLTLWWVVLSSLYGTYNLILQRLHFWPAITTPLVFFILLMNAFEMF